MIFNALMEAAGRQELWLVDGAICHWHLRRDGQLTICELIVLPERRGQGIGTTLLERLKRVENATSILARCPESYKESNQWWEHRGFTREPDEATRTGRPIWVWRWRPASTS